MRGWRDTRLSPRENLLLGIGVLWSVLLFLATNLVGIPHVERVLAIGAAGWLLAIAVSRTILMFTEKRRAVVRGVFIVMVMLTSGGPLVRALGGTVAWAALIGVAVLASWLFVRLDGEPFVDAVVVFLAVWLISSPAVALFNSVREYGSSAVRDTRSPDIELTSRPNLWLIVVDGYPGPQSRAVDSSMPESGHPLEAHGFAMASSAWASYRSTNLSVPSLLDMAYPATTAAGDKASLGVLYSKIAGDNALRAILDGNGYQTIMIESGWSGGACGSPYDVCIPSAFIDDAVSWTLRQSAVGESSLPLVGVTSNIGTLHTVRALQRLAKEERDEPFFVFSHLMAPHPPFYLNENCERVVTPERSGPSFSAPGRPMAERASYFEGQRQCVDRLLSSVVSLIDRSDVVVITSDHGTDRRHQLERDPRTWSSEAVIERMNVLVATRTPDGCSVDGSFVLPNLMRNVLSCLTDGSIEEVPDRIFLGEGFELPEQRVEGLLDGMAFVDASP